MTDWAGEDLRELILVRSGGVCECCGGRRYESLHHRTPRGMGGSKDAALNSPANIGAVCGNGTTGCHGSIEVSRTIAQNYGWLVPRGHDASIIPILYRGIWSIISHEGFVEHIPPMESMRFPNPKDWLKNHQRRFRG